MLRLFSLCLKALRTFFQIVVRVCNHYGGRSSRGPARAKTHDVPPNADIADVVVLDDIALLVLGQHTEGQTVQVAVRGQDKLLMALHGLYQRIEERFTKFGPGIHNRALPAPRRIRMPVWLFGFSGYGAPEIRDHGVDEVRLAQVDHLNVLRFTREQDKSQVASRLPGRLPLRGYGFEVERIEPDELDEDRTLGKRFDNLLTICFCEFSFKVDLRDPARQKDFSALLFGFPLFDLSAGVPRGLPDRDPT